MIIKDCPNADSLPVKRALHTKNKDALKLCFLMTIVAQTSDSKEMDHVRKKTMEFLWKIVCLL
jgi:hypothetical protein